MTETARDILQDAIARIRRTEERLTGHERRRAVFARALAERLAAATDQSLRQSLPKTCGCCGHVYRTVEEWRALRYVGLQRGDGYALELRDCGRCLSTLAIAVDAEQEAA